jgi:dihydroorotase
MQTVLNLRRPDDMHVHLRDGDFMRRMAPYTARVFGRALVMPNLTDPILTGTQAKNYRLEILKATRGTGFDPLMSIQITEQTTPDMIFDAKLLGVTAGKVYPKGMTTNSENGVLDYRSLAPVFGAMQDANMMLLLHGELPGEFCLDREDAFLEVADWIVGDFPRLRVVLEHITTASAVDFVNNHSRRNLAATITVHHLFLTLDDVIGHMLEPHHFCKPVAKRPGDREVLIEAATSGSSRFFPGTDSAPHLRGRKECAHGCAGVFVPGRVSIPLLAELFEERGRMEFLERYLSEAGSAYYGLLPNSDRLIVRREDWEVEPEYDGVVPFWARKTLKWRVEELQAA